MLMGVPAGPELDGRVAEKVLGWVFTPISDTEWEWVLPVGSGMLARAYSLPPFSTSVDAALELLRPYMPQVQIRASDSEEWGWIWTVELWPGTERVARSAPGLAHAICLAVLAIKVLQGVAADRATVAEVARRAEPT